MVQSFDQILKSQGITNATGDDLVKALATTNSGAGGIQQGPLTLENLDAVMTEVLVTEQHFKLYNFLPKVPSANPYFEYNVHKGFGSRRAGLGFAEGGTPTGGLSSFRREGIYNKFLGVQGGVTHQMMVSGQNGGIFEDPNIRENRDRTMELLERLERELIFGDKDITDNDGNEVNFDGLLTALASQNSDNVVDLQGKPFGFENLDNTAENLVTKGKQATVNGYTAFMSAHVTKGLNAQYQARNVIRHNKDASSDISVAPGFKVPSYESQFGDYKLDHSILFQEVDGGVPADVAPSGAPATPAIDTQPDPATDATATMIVGTYYYSISAFNDKGESLPVVSNAAAVAATGTKVTTVISRVNGATGYRIYRGKVADGSDAKWIARVAQPASGDLTFVDKGTWQPLDSQGNTGDGIVIIMKPDPKDICIAQMAPLIKMPLPQVGTTFPFMLLLYIVSVIKAPERIRIYKNCGTYATGNTTVDSSK